VLMWCFFSLDTSCKVWPTAGWSVLGDGCLQDLIEAQPGSLQHSRHPPAHNTCSLLPACGAASCYCWNGPASPSDARKAIHCKSTCQQGYRTANQSLYAVAAVAAPAGTCCMVAFFPQDSPKQPSSCS
jgi:hypothetical protein